MKTGAVPERVRQLDRQQREGGRRTHFDVRTLQKQATGEEVSQAALAESLQYLLKMRKPNQKLAVVDIPDGQQGFVKILYLVDRSSNPIERRVFRPGLLNKLASRAALEYIKTMIGVDVSAQGNVSSQIAEIRRVVDPMVTRAHEKQKKERSVLIDPPQKNRPEYRRSHSFS